MSLKSLPRALKDNFDQQFEGIVCGIDEVGRGPLAGPVMAACVIIKPDTFENPIWLQVTDSKKLTVKKRDALFGFITENAYYGIAEATVAEIDQLNIHQATLLAMKRAFESMKNFCVPDIALIDGKFSPKLPCRTQTVIKGDSLSISIGAASIIAKVTRDRLMSELHARHPYYAWDRNAGYGTKAHMDGLERFGVTVHHRLSFAPCAAAKIRDVG